MRSGGLSAKETGDYRLKMEQREPRVSWWEWRAVGVAMETREGFFTKERNGLCLTMTVGSDSECCRP